MRRLAENGHRTGGLAGLLRVLTLGGAPADRHDEADFRAVRSAEAALNIETRPPRPNDVRGDPWQVCHDWRNAVDQKAVIELLGEQRGVDVSLHQKDVPHGRYLDVGFADGGAATIVLDQGFGAWAPPRDVTVRYDFGANAAAQVKRLATVNAVLQRRGVGKTYFVATSG
jgi:DEAD/DEAH box helicase domain-containing protein